VRIHRALAGADPHASDAALAESLELLVLAKSIRS
jgi:hypothetical protein